jgi:hypothetical protein
MRDLTKQLIDSLLMDEFPRSTAVYVDFGIPLHSPTNVFGAYQWGYKREMFSEAELDRALGNGPELTKLVNRGSNPYGKGMIIVTAYDDMEEEEDDGM